MASMMVVCEYNCTASINNADPLLLTLIQYKTYERSSFYVDIFSMDKTKGSTPDSNSQPLLALALYNEIGYLSQSTHKTIALLDPSKYKTFV